MLKRAIIFLDIDGVIAHPRGGRRAVVCAECVARLNRITEATGAGIVLTSFWRQGDDRAVADMLRNIGVIAPLNGQTPKLVESANESGMWAGYCRGDEIKAWLAEHGSAVDRFVILDDAEEMGVLEPFLVKTDFRTGITEEIGRTSILKLNYPSVQ